MKDKILYTEVTTAIENLTLALRKYSGASMYCTVSVTTRDDDESGEAPDFYSMSVREIGNPDVILSEGGFIYRDQDGQIIKVDRIEDRTGDGGAS